MIVLAMALRAAGETMAAAVSWTLGAMYFAAAQTVALVSVLEIGPNLLAAVTSIIGAAVLLGQIYLASKVRKVDHVEKKTEENRERIEAIEDGGGN